MYWRGPNGAAVTLCCGSPRQARAYAQCSAVRCNVAITGGQALRNAKSVGRGAASLPLAEPRASTVSLSPRAAGGWLHLYCHRTPVAHSQLRVVLMAAPWHRCALR